MTAHAHVGPWRLRSLADRRPACARTTCHHLPRRGSRPGGRLAHLQSILTAICETLDIDLPATREQAVAALRDLTEGHRATVAAIQR